MGYSGGWLHRDGDGGSHRPQRSRPQGHAASLPPDRQQRAGKVRFRVQQCRVQQCRVQQCRVQFRVEQYRVQQTVEVTQDVQDASARCTAHGTAYTSVYLVQQCSVRYRLQDKVHRLHTVQLQYTAQCRVHRLHTLRLHHNTAYHRLQCTNTGYIQYSHKYLRATTECSAECTTGHSTGSYSFQGAMQGGVKGTQCRVHRLALLV